MRLFLLLTFLISFSTGLISAQKIELSKGWKLISPESVPEENRKNYEVEIPNTVLQTLIENGTIPDPYLNNNEQKVDWVFDHNWEYELDFEIDEKTLKNEKIEIIFKGIDTWGELRINEKLPKGGGQVNNMFREYKWEIKNLLKAGSNKISLKLISPRNLAKEFAGQFSHPFPAPSDAGSIKSSPFFRKAGYHFGWDWAPYLPDLGIWKPVYLDAWSGARLREVKVETGKLNSEWAILRAEVIVEAERPGRYILFAACEGLLKPIELHFDAKGGRQRVPVTFALQQPQLWWPTGLGKQHLYDLKFVLQNNARIEQDQKNVQYGIREIKLIREKDRIGESFYFEVNGKRIFAKGANVVPGESILSRLNKTYYRELIADAREANMNMLRVWGGGIYENDDFYRLCDSAGILVWQDFMFACAMYPTSGTFGETIKPEIEYQVKRLRNHPCLALWCGNNEIEVAWNNWGWQDEFNLDKSVQKEIWSQYQHLFDTLIPKTLSKHAPAHNYISTSPLSNWGKPENFKHGNMHYWGVWHGEEPFENFRKNVPRFMSEYGFQSFPETSSLAQVNPIKGLKVDSEEINARQKSYKGNRLIIDHMKRWYGKKRRNKIQEFSFLSQLLQKEAMKIAITSHRMAQPFCAGTLYWQLNDCWPGISWSTRDYFGRWKAAHYQVKRSYQQELLAFSLSGDTIRVQAVTDGQVEIQGQISLRLIDFYGKELWKREIETTVSPSKVKEVFRSSRSFLLAKNKPEEILMVTEWKENGKVLTRDLLYFVMPGELDLPKADYSMELLPIPETDGFQVKLKGISLVKDLTFSQEGNFGHFSDNSFDLLPGESRVITFSSRGEWKGSFEEGLKIMHLNEILGR